MCGINGLFAYNPSGPLIDSEELIRTRDHMAARGPDGCGLWISQNQCVGLGHRRLAIIDLSERAAQPMSLTNGSLQITFNGEIYNYKELRKHLSAYGVIFRSQSDTEVLLHLYQKYGEAMVYHLRGMFAFAIWDELKNELFLARDPYGIKPLYYSDDGHTFRFASQVKALIAGGAISREPDPAGVVGFLQWGSVPEPGTIYQQIQSLPAGHTVKISRNGATPSKSYWSLAHTLEQACEEAEKIPRGEEPEYVRNVLFDSVKTHLVADVPVGAFLSGGLDSSTLVGLAKEASGNFLEALTLTFTDFEGGMFDEAPLARSTAQHLGVKHEVRAFTVREVEKDLPRFFAAMDQPTVDALNTWFISSAAKQNGLKVILSGLGGDELLGGYPTFDRIPERVRRLAIPSRIPLSGFVFRNLYSFCAMFYKRLGAKNAGLLAYGGTYEGAYYLERGIYMPWELTHVLDPDFAKQGLLRLCRLDTDQSLPSNGRLNPFAKVMLLESSYYMRNQLLRDIDWAGMAHSLEIRIPFVDTQVTEKIAGLAATGRLGKAKAILSKMVSKGLPQKVLTHPKTGFSVPLGKWLCESKEFEAWKRIPFLRRANVHDNNRWAYTVLARMPEMKHILK